MYVIKLLVYEQKRLSLGKFSEILKANWQGAELLQAEIKSRIPHFGNDKEEVDSLAAELFREAVEDFDSEPPLRGGHYNMGPRGGYENAHIYLAEKTFATPDGRRNGEAFASGLSPWASMDRNGPTALHHIAALANELEHVQQIELEPYHPLGESKSRNLGRKDGFHAPFASEADKNRWRETLSALTRVPLHL